MPFDDEIPENEEFEYIKLNGLLDYLELMFFAKKIV